MFQDLLNTPLSTVVLITGFILVLIGLWGMLMHKNIIRIIVGFTLMDTGIHMVMVAIGYLTGGKAPIIEGANKNIVYVDPVPSALVLTSIVIGLGITAIMLSYAIQIHKAKKSLSIDDCAEMKW